ELTKVYGNDLALWEWADDHNDRLKAAEREIENLKKKHKSDIKNLQGQLDNEKGKWQSGDAHEYQMDPWVVFLIVVANTIWILVLTALVATLWYKRKNH
ncbi:hypothetical protein ACFL2C_04280, partial [Patescibacteria group bacterium]